MPNLDPGIRYVGERHFIIGNDPTPIPYWEPDYKIEKAVIFGGGPSHVEVDISGGICDEFCVFAINSACRSVQEFVKEKDILYFSDNSWSENYLNLIQGWKGKVVTSNRNTKARLKDLVHRIKIEDLVNFIQIKSDCVYASSGHTAAVLAAYMGARKIILIGFECKKINERTHGHNDYRQGNLNVFKERFIPGWKGLALGFQDLKIEVINSTPDSEVKCFPYVPFNEAVRNV